MPIIDLIILYIVFRIKHFLGDYALQTNWMGTSKGNEGIEGYKALLSHAAVHSTLTVLITLFYAPTLIWLAAIDFFLHAAIDRVKAITGRINKWNPKDKAFWVSLGIDQELHNYTHLAFIIIIYGHLSGWIF